MKLVYCRGQGKRGKVGGGDEKKKVGGAKATRVTVCVEVDV